MDFTLSIYKYFLESFISRGYSFISLEDFICSKFYLHKSSLIILRHDVDRLPQNSLRTAELENSLGIKGSYYFRIVASSFNRAIMRKISNSGHEIGYHYEDVDLAYRQFKVKNSKLKIKEEVLIDAAYRSFNENLRKMREISEIKTICMHGSPLSKYDNKILWKKYDYKKLGILAEPYYDIDFNEFAYFTDTGRRWNGKDTSVRDIVQSKYRFNFKSTIEIIENIDKLPPKIMFTIHPQRWNNKFVPWLNEYFSQNIKNIIKKYFYVKR